ncbi:polyol transporter 5 [Lolium perenne]|uniref:polyol transporter 5 n=1 Tax=Lolium perenne TaxID=4522 RepID=UPI0021F5A7F3|nr:polyol transporter 5-like [Lolium perenne]XP_051183347.1 polyol transporter 5-like [Lolium perenne]
MSTDADAVPVAVAPAKRPSINKYAFACALLASMNSVLLGYDISVMSGAQLFMKEDLKITDTQIEILAGVISIYSLFGSLAAGLTSDWLGRRYTMVLAAAIFFTGALVMGLAPNYAFLMAGRFVAGIGVGYALMIAPVYTAEVAPTSSRGFLTTFPEVFNNFGILLGYVSNFAFARLPVHQSWRAMFLVGAVPPVFLGFAVLAMPESPRWLVMRGRIEDARRVLRRTSDSHEEAEERLLDIKRVVGIPADATDADDVVAIVRANEAARGQGVWRELLINPSRPVRRMLVAGLGLMFIQQATGVDCVVMYSPRVFEAAGIKSKTNSLGASMAVGACKTFFIPIATLLLDRIGRRPLLLASGGGMAIFLFTLATSLLMLDRRPESEAKALGAVSIAAMLSFVASFASGLGPVAWVYCSEIYPLRLRAQAAAIGTGLNRLMGGATTMSFLSLTHTITIAGAFYLYACIAAAGWVFMYFFLPETMGRSLEDTGKLFGKDTDDDVDGVVRHERKKSTELIGAPQ